MTIRSILFLFIFFAVNYCSAQTSAPEQFLGYKIGSHFTPHYKIIEYFKSIAAANPATVKLEQYGKTNEGRPLMVAYISSAANISNLDKIRTKQFAISRP